MIFTLTTTKQGLPCVEMHDGKLLVAKIYPNDSGDKLRIVLPELRSFKQTLIDIDAHWLEFWRNAEAPDASRLGRPEAANITCSVKSCKKLASFIVEREAFCVDHRR